jgi:hypothetical protein
MEHVYQHLIYILPKQDMIQKLKIYTWKKKINDELVDALQLAVREDYKSTANMH